MMSAASIRSLPRTPANAAVEQQFHELKSQWQADTQFLSDPDRIVGHPAFQAIIALGDDAIPLLLAELQESPGLWVWALPEITGENPVPTSDNGDIRQMTAAWLRWGREKGMP